jgi:serine/threonine protein kinase
MKRAPPEERERLRREMEERTNSGGNRRSWKAVHLLSAEEVQSLFGDVTHGLAFLVRPDRGSDARPTDACGLLQHDRSILHLDLKPGNVLLTWDEGRLM